jgi:hypothetical protein
MRCRRQAGTVGCFEVMEEGGQLQAGLREAGSRMRRRRGQGPNHHFRY